MKALAVICLLGAVIGLCFGYVLIAAHARDAASFAGTVFLTWISYPDNWWPWPMFGAVIAGLSYAACRTIRKSI
jgi:hypothetical protein